MMSRDRHDDKAREGSAEVSPQQSRVIMRSLEEHGVEVTGSESDAELSMMQGAADAFRRAADSLAGRAALGSEALDDRCRHVVPPRAADETPRQYAERVNRMTERFRALTQDTWRDRTR